MTKDEAKARVADLRLAAPSIHHTAQANAQVVLESVDRSDGTALVSIHRQWVTADACKELAAYFKKLGKLLKEAA